MKDFERLLRNVNNLDLNDVFLAMWKRNDVQKFVIRLITEGEQTSQLYNLGQDGNGKFLGLYTPNTVDAKLFGSGDSRVDHITLKDSGGYYDSYVFIPKPKGFSVISNPIMDDGKNLFDRFGEDIEKLSEDNTELVLAFFEPDFNKELEKRLLQ